MGKSKNNGLAGVTICMFGLLSLVCAWFIFQNGNLSKEKKNLQEQVDKTVSENDELKKAIESSNDKLNSLKNKTCEYTKTFLYLGDYKYTATVPTHKFIIVDQFQMFSPIILEIDTEQFDIEFKEKHNYEITFVGGISDSAFRRATIKEIKETDRIGLNQIQESCKIQ